MARICMLVTTELHLDPRVQKEALIAHDNGYEVTVICRVHNGDPRPYRVISLNVSRVPTRGRKYLERMRIILLMIWYAVRSHPQIVHANDLDTLPAAFIASLLTGAKLVYDSHEYYVESNANIGAF